jgi:short-subunit dehydrogenase
MEITHRFLPGMRENGGVSIINISSFGGIIGLPFGTPYNSSKFAVEGFSEALSNEVAQFGVKVKIIEPGAIDTNFRNNMQMLGAENIAYQASMGSFFPNYLSMSEKIEKHSTDDVANTIYEACTDGTDKLRYVSGNDAQFFIDLKQKNDEKTFLNGIRDNFKN